MNCTRCNAELPNGAQFCSQCGNTAANSPIFAQDAQSQQTNRKGNFLTGCGCACAAGALLTLMLFAAALFLDEGTSLHDISLDHTFEAGSDFTLYGKTLDNQDFDWESFRGKYVLVKFTATWCGPCRMKVPGMLEAYKKYHDKGLEVVSVYIWEREPEAVTTVKKFVEHEQLPWIIISESLTQKAGQQPLGEKFGIRGVPTMLLVDKEGKVLPPTASLMQELKKLYGE